MFAIQYCARPFAGPFRRGVHANPAVIIPTVICMWQVSEICHAGEGRRRADGCDMFRAACLLLPICPYGRPVPRPCEKAGAKNESVDAVRVVIYVDVCGRAALEGLSDQDRDRLFNNYGIFNKQRSGERCPSGTSEGRLCRREMLPKPVYSTKTQTRNQRRPHAPRQYVAPLLIKGRPYGGLGRRRTPNTQERDRRVRGRHRDGEEAG